MMRLRLNIEYVHYQNWTARLHRNQTISYKISMNSVGDFSLAEELAQLRGHCESGTPNGCS